MRWAEIAIDSDTAAVDAIGQCLSSVGCGGFELREKDGETKVVGYLPVDDRLELRLDELSGLLERLPEFGFDGAGQELTIRTVEEEDWANAWKAYFKPIRLGKRLIVTPPWEDSGAQEGDVVIVIDPGMAFGTGSHPTTQLCLEALEQHVKPGDRVADVGTGSGILSIAAAKLGASHIEACDIDSLAVKITLENAVVNNVQFSCTETLPEGEFDVVVANILADVILGMREELYSLTRPSGTFIASGIIDTRGQDVENGLVEQGFVHVETTRRGEWIAVVVRRPEATKE